MSHTVSVLVKTCPTCKHTWVVRHNKVLLGEVFLRTDFTIAMFDHVAICGMNDRIQKAYVYNGGVDEENNQSNRIV